MTTKVADDWRLRGQRYRLEAERCDHCGEMIFPPRDICPACKKPAKTPHTLSGRGEVYTYSTVRAAPQGFEVYAPYTEYQGRAEREIPVVVLEPAGD